jgi:hypothetical protein
MTSWFSGFLKVVGSEKEKGECVADCRVFEVGSNVFEPLNVAHIFFSKVTFSGTSALGLQLAVRNKPDRIQSSTSLCPRFSGVIVTNLPRDDFGKLGLAEDHGITVGDELLAVSQIV